jgi:ribosomal protein S18 acetylase RimI-like enzyme
MTVTLIPADQFTVEELTEAYNHTRVDYMVPMPMNAARLREYIYVYDVDMSQSLVALEKNRIIGLGMLARRENRSWITRLGLVANQRGRGTGELLMRGLLANSDQLGIEKNMLEVIKGNKPAHQLFRKLDFQDLRELLIMRRPPGNGLEAIPKVVELDQATCLEYLKQRQEEQAWTNQTKSLHQVDAIEGFSVDLPDGCSGWLVYQPTMFNLSRLMFSTSGCDDVRVMKALLTHLHHRYPNTDTYTENIPADDPHLPAFEALGYIETFRRVEMVRYPGL